MAELKRKRESGECEETSTKKPISNNLLGPDEERRKKLIMILEREIKTEISALKNHLETVEDRIFQTKQCLIKVRQAVVSEFYRQENTRLLQKPLHPAVKKILSGKEPRSPATEIKNEKLDELSEDNEIPTVPLSSNNSMDFYSSDSNTNDEADCLVTVSEDEKDINETIVHTDSQENSNFPTCLQDGIERELKGSEIELNERDEVKSVQNVEISKVPRYIPPKQVDKDVVKQSQLRVNSVKQKIRLVIGNVSKWLGHESQDATHKWTAYVKSLEPKIDLGSVVSKAKFFLHPSYKPNDIIQVERPPIKITRRGWGEFALRVQLHFYNEFNKPVDLIHHLKLDRTHTGMETFGSETVADVWLYLNNDVSESPEGSSSNKSQTSDGKRRLSKLERGNHFKAVETYYNNNHSIYQKNPPKEDKSRNEFPIKCKIEPLTTDMDGIGEVSKEPDSKHLSTGKFMNKRDQEVKKLSGLSRNRTQEIKNEVLESNLEDGLSFIQVDQLASGFETNSELLIEQTIECKTEPCDLESESIEDMFTATEDDGLNMNEHISNLQEQDTGSAFLSDNYFPENEISCADQGSYVEIIDSSLNFEYSDSMPPLTDPFESEFPEESEDLVEQTIECKTEPYEINEGSIENQAVEQENDDFDGSYQFLNLKEEETGGSPLIFDSGSQATESETLDEGNNSCAFLNCDYLDRGDVGTNELPIQDMFTVDDEENYVVEQTIECNTEPYDVMEDNMEDLLSVPEDSEARGDSNECLSTRDILDQVEEKKVDLSTQDIFSVPPPLNKETSSQLPAIENLVNSHKCLSDTGDFPVLEKTLDGNSEKQLVHDTKTETQKFIPPIKPSSVTIAPFGKLTLENKKVVCLNLKNDQPKKTFLLKLDSSKLKELGKQIVMVPTSSIKNVSSGIFHDKATAQSSNSCIQLKMSPNFLKQGCSDKSIKSLDSSNLSPVLKSKQLALDAQPVDNGTLKTQQTKETKSVSLKIVSPSLLSQNQSILSSTESPRPVLRLCGKNIQIVNPQMEKKIAVNSLKKFKSDSLLLKNISNQSEKKLPQKVLINLPQVPRHLQRPIILEDVPSGLKLQQTGSGSKIIKQSILLNNTVLIQKKVIPGVSLLKKLDPKVEVPQSAKEPLVSDLKNCPSQDVECAVKWLVKHFPLVDKRACFDGFRAKHPYCAPNAAAFLNWPLPKQRAGEWLRAKTIEKLLPEVCPALTPWTTIEILKWSRARGFTPVDPKKDLKELPSSDAEVKFPYTPANINEIIQQCKQLESEENIDVVNVEEIKSSLELVKENRPLRMDQKNIIVPLDNDLLNLGQFIEDHCEEVDASFSGEEIVKGLFYPASLRLMISVFMSIAEDLIRRSYENAWSRFGESPPSVIEMIDVKAAIAGREEFDVFTNEGLGVPPGASTIKGPYDQQAHCTVPTVIESISSKEKNT